MVPPRGVGGVVVEVMSVRTSRGRMVRGGSAVLHAKGLGKGSQEPAPSHSPPEQVVPDVRWLVWQRPATLQVSWAEHSLGPAPQLAPTLGEKPVAEAKGEQTWHGLLGLASPEAKHVWPIWQPLQTQSLALQTRLS